MVVLVNVAVAVTVRRYVARLQPRLGVNNGLAARRPPVHGVHGLVVKVGRLSAAAESRSVEQDKHDREHGGQRHQAQSAC